MSLNLCLLLLVWVFSKDTLTLIFIDILCEIKDTCYDEADIPKEAAKKFNNKSVIANWGNKKCYFVTSVDFN